MSWAKRTGARVRTRNVRRVGARGIACCMAGLIILSSLACSRRGGKDFKAGSDTDQFTVVLASDPETFDPSRMSGAPEGRVAMNIFEGLLMPGKTTEGLKDASQLVVPGVAERFELSPDGKTYTFHLRKNAKWSDGEPITSADFVFAWKRLLTPKFPADYGSMFWIIENAREFNKGKLKDWSQVGVKAPDPHTLIVQLKQSTPYFPELVAFYSFFPVPKHVVEKHGERWTKPEHIVSNGPYHITEYKPQRHVQLKENPHYWDTKNVAIKQVKLRIIPDQNAVVNAYKTGALHWSGAGLPVAQITNLLTHPDYSREPMLGTYYFRVNVSKKSPMQDARVRQALNLSLDRVSLVEQTMNGLYAEAHTFVPPLAGFKSTTSISFNLKKARALMAEAGYPDGKGFPELELLYNTSENHKLIAEAVQKMWKRGLNIEVRLVNKEWKTYLQDVDTLNYQVARAGWIGDYNDPMTFLDMWVSDNGNNDTGWKSPKYDALIESSTKETDPAKRLKILAEAEALLLKEGPVLPVYFYTNNLLVANRLEGFEPHNRDIHLFKYMKLPEGGAAADKNKQPKK